MLSPACRGDSTKETGRGFYRDKHLHQEWSTRRNIWTTIYRISITRNIDRTKNHPCLSIQISLHLTHLVRRTTFQQWISKDHFWGVSKKLLYILKYTNNIKKHKQRTEFYVQLLSQDIQKEGFIDMICTTIKKDVQMHGLWVHVEEKQHMMHKCYKCPKNSCLLKRMQR